MKISKFKTYGSFIMLIGIWGILNKLVFQRFVFMGCFGGDFYDGNVLEFSLSILILLAGILFFMGNKIFRVLLWIIIAGLLSNSFLHFYFNPFSEFDIEIFTGVFLAVLFLIISLDKKIEF